MKRWAFLLCFAVVSCGWSRQDLVLEGAWQVLHVIDYGQTLDIAKHPKQYHECNPLLDEHPSEGDVNLFAVVAGILHPVITGALPPKAEIFGIEFSPRTVWQAYSLGEKAGCVINNFSIGLCINY